MPGHEGSPEERANKLEIELKRAQNRIAVLEASEQEPSRSGSFAGLRGASRDESRRHALADGARSIAEDIRAGKPVNPEDIFKASKPLLRDLTPLFDRMRLKQQNAVIDGLTGELARKYDLTPQQQESLKGFFEVRASEEARRWRELIGRDDTGLEDLVRATRDVRPDEGLDNFMQGVLSGDKLVAFKAERLAERAARVERQADARVQRLDAIVKLDDAQRDQIFGLSARGSRDYDPSMVIEGAHGEIGAIPTGNREATMLAVLRPDQHAAYEAERLRRREEAAKDMESIGLALPPDWEMLADDSFR
jgi:hypothetical protein